MFGRRITFIVVLMVFTTAIRSEEPADKNALQLFEERIMPIFRSPKPSSCVQCHLSSVDIKNYILPSHEDTFLALRQQGLVNMQTPDKSKILTLISMGERDPDKGARLIHEKTRQAEFEAFSSWIKACCNDPKLRDRKLDETKVIGPTAPLEVVRHARKSRIVESFTRNIWSQRMRCFPCHTPHELDGNNPKHKVPIQKHEEFVRKYGGKMNIFRQTPAATVEHLIAGSRRKIPDRYPLINLQNPAKSLLLLKPTSKVPPKDDSGEFAKPSSMDPVSHMGGLKMHVNDQSYKSFIAWIQDYAAVTGGDYVSVQDLPADNWVPTQRVLRLRDVPESWGDRTTVQMFVHTRDHNSDEWSAEPVAFTQNVITPRRMVNGPLFLFRTGKDESPHADDSSFPLRPGRFLIRVCVDRDNKLTEDPTLLLGKKDTVGQAEIDAHWRIGFPKAEVFSARTLK